MKNPLVAVVSRRLALSVPLVFIVTALVFVLTRLAPNNALYTLYGGLTVDKAVVEAIRHQLGLDQPIQTAYWHWLSHAVRGDLGRSEINRTAISATILQRLPVTLSLVGGTLIVSVGVGVGLGVVSAVRGGPLGRAVDALSMFGWLVPVYWLAAMLVVVFAVKLRWLPATGYVPLKESPTEWLRSLVLPVTSMSVGAIVGFAKFTREGMLDALASEYVRMARANGVPARSIILQHAFKSASIQVVTLMGLLTIGLLAGTVFVENVFVLPGMGSLMVTGVTSGDLPVVQGVALVFTLIVIGINLAVDLAYVLLSPKVRLS